MDSFFQDNGLNPKVDIKMPGSETESLASKKDIGKEVHKEYVSTAITEEEDKVEYPMLCINASKLTHIPPYAFIGLHAILDTCKADENDRDDTIPVYIMTSNGKLSKIGKGSYIKLYMYLDNFVKTAINSKLNVYHFEAENKKGTRIDKGDPTKIKLNI